MSEHLDMYKYWFNLWSIVDFEDGFWHEGTVEELIEEHGKEKLIYAKENGWLEFYTANNNELETFDRWDITDNKTDVEMHFNAKTLAQDSKILKGDKTYESDLKRVNELYVQTPEELLDMYKFWFKHWSSIDFANDLFDEQTKEDMFEEYGEDKIMYAAKKKWVTFHYDDWYGQIHDIATFESGADETGIVDMHFNAETLAQDSEILKGDKTYESDLKRVNELYFQTPKKRQRCDEVHEMNPPKRAKVVSENELWEFWYGKWEKTTFCKGGHYEYPIIQEDRKLDPVYYEGAFKDVSSDLDNLSPGIEKGYITMWESNGKEIKEMPDDPKEVVIRLNPNTLMNNMHLYCDDKLFEHRCVRMELHGWYMLGVRYRRDLE